MNQWIDVNKKLPEISGRYAVVYRYKNLPLKAYIADWDELDYRWLSLPPDNIITHWMPLPQIPEEPK